MSTIHVSVVTPTYNRRAFIPMAIRCYMNQHYNKEDMEWIILDDGTESAEDLFQEAAKVLPNIRYYRVETKMKIGAKRNLLNQYANGDIIVCMDDDDYYPPEHISSVVDMFKKYPRANIAGSSEVLLYYVDTKLIYTYGPIHSNHATNNTFAYRKKYTTNHSYDESVDCGEEASFTNDFTELMIQLDPMKTILIICHSSNTVNKFRIRDCPYNKKEDTNQTVRKTPYLLSTLLSDSIALDFYKNLSLA